VPPSTAHSTTKLEPATAITKHPDKEKFEEGEVEFLQTFLDEYLAADSSNKKKGTKRSWEGVHLTHG
jgi:hypothetical protein